MEKPLEISGETLERFWRKVQVCSHGELCKKCCWPWMANIKSRAGYGLFDLPAIGKKVRAHRVMWIVEVRDHFPIPEDVQILHHCDHTWCVSPWHLYEGTPAHNVADKIARKRWGKPGDAFTSKGAARVRRLYLRGCYTIAQLADLFHVRTNSISAILRQKTHQEVNDGLQIFIDQMMHMRDYKRLGLFTRPKQGVKNAPYQRIPPKYYEYLGTRIPYS